MKYLYNLELLGYLHSSDLSVPSANRANSFSRSAHKVQILFPYQLISHQDILETKDAQ